MSTMATTAPAPAVASKSGARRTIAAMTIGNALEFFDFTVFSFFAITIGKLFFPSMSPYGQLMLAVATFGVGYVMRPVGGVVIGAYADRKGRKAAMTLTINLMALGCLMIGLAPTYAQAGLFGPCLIVFARLLQGFSAGGEVGASTTMLIELSTPRTRGYFASWQFASQGLGVTAGAVTAMILSGVLPVDALESWGWRVPFLLGVVIAPIGAYIRRHQAETLKLDQRAPERSTVSIVFRDHFKSVVLGTLLTLGSTVTAYTITFYMPTFAIRELGLSTSNALLAGTLSGLMTFLVSPLAGKLTDRVGRKPLILFGRIGILLLVYPCFLWMIGSPGEQSLMISVIALSILLAIMTSSAITVIPEMFPQAVRATGMSIVYSVGVAIFGGFQQLVATWLISFTGNKLAPAFYLMACLLVSTFSLIWIKDRTGQVLN